MGARDAGNINFLPVQIICTGIQTVFKEESKMAAKSNYRKYKGTNLTSIKSKLCANPELSEAWIDICADIIQELWDNYSWGLHLEDEEYESEEEEQEAYDQAWEDWQCDCNINVDEATEKDLEDVAPGGNIEHIEIVYDER